MNPASMQQSTGDATTPTPYPDGLITHHADGTATYPEAYTGVRPVEPMDEWYHFFGFHYHTEDDYSWDMWSWGGLDWINWESVEQLFGLPMFTLLVGGMLFPLIYWARRDLFQPLVSLVAWSGILISAVLIMVSDNDMLEADGAQLIMPIATLLLVLNRPSRSFRTALLRYAVLTTLFAFPSMILAVLDPDTWMSQLYVFALVAWAAVTPLALRVGSTDGKPRAIRVRNGITFVAGFLPMALLLATDSFDAAAWKCSHLLVAALSLFAWISILRSGVPPQRGVLAT
jgi:hypothetical protein